MKSRGSAVLCAAAILVSGCAGQKEVNLDHNLLSNMHRIAVVGPQDPVPVGVTTEDEAKAQAVVAAAAAIPFLGVLGAAVAGGVAGGISAEIAHETSEPMAQKVEAEHYQLGGAMQLSLVDALKANGYDAAAVTVTRKNPNAFADSYAGIKDQADLVLDANASAVCSNVGSGDNTHFRPVVAMNIRLSRASDGNVLMRKLFVLDDTTAKPDAYKIKGDTQFDLPDYAALKADVGKCLDGVKAAVPVLSQDIATVLAAPSQLPAVAPPISTSAKP